MGVALNNELTRGEHEHMPRLKDLRAWHDEHQFLHFPNILRQTITIHVRTWGPTFMIPVG